MPVPAHPHHLQLTLANGLRVSLRHAPRLKRCAAALRVAAGSHDAPLAWPGLAHFLEHLLFLGTEAFPATDGLMAYVQRHGGQVNASTRERTTDFFFEVPTPVFGDALQRLGDMLAHPRLAMDEQLREREVLQAEFIAWSQDAEAQHQVAILQGLAAGHPLRGFHAGNRDSLPVPRENFQQGLRGFYQDFYQSGQMTLSLAGPQSLQELQALAQHFADSLRAGPRRPQQAPPALMGDDNHRYPYLHKQQLHHLIACNAPREALEFLCTWLNATAPGGLLAELQARGWASALHARVLYLFAGQALLDIGFTLQPQGSQQPQAIEGLLNDWLRFFADSDWTGLREEYALLIERQRQISGALTLARQDSENLATQVSEPHCQALKSLLNTLQSAPAQQAWQLPPGNPFLQQAPQKQRPGLIRGQTSAHRGLRTFAQDRSRGRRELPGLSFSQALPADSDEGALYLRWQLNSPAPCLGNPLQALRTNARQAGVELSFEAAGNDWLLKMSGLHEPMPAIVEQLARDLAQPDLWQQAPSSPPPQMAIRELLKALPTCMADTGRSADVNASPDLWATARWQGLGMGLPAACEMAINNAAARLPGQCAESGHKTQPINGQHRWQTVATDGNEAALLLFCPAPSQSLADEADWRLLAHLAQTPFYQRLRVELQLGYAVFSGIRQLNGQTGLLFGVQSPNVALAGLLDPIQAFLKQLPALIKGSEDLGNTPLAQQFSPQTLPTSQAAELLWQAHLAGHGADYLEPLQQLIQTRTRQHLIDAAQRLNQAAGGWQCLANGAAVGAFQ
ncbi:coenzyme PQQ biosynthesis probable peptidase PqqF [Pseudomonas gessardii]|uniref:Coenzyme PQQ synthesis protein F n=1 Tax=Pseudomonas gessardii TaxID=78544 RepID=A0A7Y1QL47_9PSED|nr:pyrroloquinoline quinone biosynthesis protein PqqF [Pseudomonas gessardii]MRU50468.1 pyrroloquinoline quinone biosynthesis protein PqqF [Pseudomonas gessardii]NNA96376.1 pyrroloquinoline quinone biosynthesis protein PqqF [Pseudomonas gessardii]ONH45069.1 coenzyme PQQ biosynthesis protein PqqF [Pseudomonas gessardii]SDR24105.1 coenzyme PQQ biosynthesis probable peptidase PqqF [Pseudomonas gessardii]